MADDGRLASKITSDVDVLHSDGPLLKAGSSVLFKVRLCHKGYSIFSLPYFLNSGQYNYSRCRYNFATMTQFRNLACSLPPDLVFQMVNLSELL